MKKIAVLGYGVVGSGVVELFYRNQKKIEKNVGDAAEVGYILDLENSRMIRMEIVWYTIFR